MNFDQVQTRKKMRNPLSTLSDNVPLPQNKVRKRTESLTKKNYKKESGVRSKSTSGVETKLKFPQDLEKITVRSTATNTSEDDIFFDAEEHLLFSYISGQKHQATELESLQEMSNTSSQYLHMPVFKKPAAKITLIEKRKRLSRNHNVSFQIQHMFADCLYDVEYFTENYAYMIQTERKYVFRKSGLMKYIDFKYRILIVNWMMYVQHTLDLSEISLFMTVRMVDNMLIKAKISEAKYGLVSIACMWIASKMYDTNFILATKLFAVCNGKYSKSGIISMEKEILRIFNFNINYPEPLTFLYYYMNNEDLEKDHKVLFGAMFLLEMFTFLLEFSSTSPSVLAAVALYLVLMRFDMSCDAFLEYIQYNVLNVCTFKLFSEQMWKCVKEILAADCFKNEVIAKYSTEGKLNVVQYFTSD